MRSRLMAAAATLATGGLVLAAPAPAHAQSEADLAIELTGTTVAESASGKFGTLTLTNRGPAEASDIVFRYDVSSLDTSKVELTVEGCAPDPATGVAECVIDPDGLAPGEHATFFPILEKVAGATGDAGTVTVSVRHGGTDPNEENNTTSTVPVSIEGSGPDLLVHAPDVHNEGYIDFENRTVEVLDTPVVPGSEALVEVFVGNQGDQPVSGVELTIELPEHVTFTLAEEQCTHAVGDRTTTCQYTSLTLDGGYAPDSEESCDWTGSCGWAWFPVLIAEDAPSPEGLTGGVAEGWGIGPALFSTLSAPAELPRTLRTGPPMDVDPTDNLSEFTVFVSEAPDDSDGGDDQGGNNDDQAGGSGGGLDDQDPLPVTGVPALLIAGAGAVALAVGTGMLLLARRRRVVLETPDSSTE